MGFPNIPDNEIEVIKNHVAEIFIIADMGGLQHFQMRVVFAGAIPFNDFMPDSIDKGVEVLNLHGGNPIYINLNVRKKLDKVLMSGKLTEQTVVNPTAFQKQTRLAAIDVFLRTLMKQETLITTFDPMTYHILVERMTVYSKDKVIVQFKNGMEIQA